jgi:hypothetical protein
MGRVRGAPPLVVNEVRIRQAVKGIRKVMAAFVAAETKG